VKHRVEQPPDILDKSPFVDLDKPSPGRKLQQLRSTSVASFSVLENHIYNYYMSSLWHCTMRSLICSATEKEPLSDLCARCFWRGHTLVDSYWLKKASPHRPYISADHNHRDNLLWVLETMASSEPLVRPLFTNGAAVLSETRIYKGHPSFDCISWLIASLVYPFRNATKRFEANPLSIIRGCLDIFGRRLWGM
jgi:hypothetical protein